LPGLDAGFGLTELGRRDDPGRLPGITDTKADFDKAVAQDARAHGQRHAGMDDLEIRHLNTLAATRYLTPGRQGSGTELNAERGTGLGGWDDDDGSLNLEHRNLLNEQTMVRPSGRIPGKG
jgi:hypothetical protein